MGTLNEAASNGHQQLSLANVNACNATAIGSDTTAIGGRVSYAKGNRGAGELVVHRASYGPNGRGARVAFTIVDSPIGRILIAATHTGVCWIGVCDSDSRLEAELRADLAAAEIARDADGLAALARSVVAYVSGRTREIALPIDLRTT